MPRKKTISFLLKILIACLALVFLYNQFIAKQSIDHFSDINIIDKIKNNIYGIIVVFLMMFLNWFIEALKWRFLISKIEKISILRSLRAIFSGITVSAFTPNRIGEYGGRVFCLKEGDRGQAVLITVIGSMSQLITTIVFGTIGVLCLPMYNSEILGIIVLEDITYSIFIFLFVLLDILLIFFFLNTSVVSNLLFKIKFLDTYKKYTTVFSFYNSKELLKVLMYSVLRYVVFSTQFFILLRLFDVHITYFDAFVLITSMFLIISIIPSIAITELGVRGSIAILLFGLVSSNNIGIILSTFFLWGINLLIPSLIGIFFVFTLNFFRK